MDRLDTGQSGQRTADAETRIAAEMVAAGHAMPAPAREDLQTALVGDRQPVSGMLQHARDRWEQTTPAQERNWVTWRIDRFSDDGIRISDADAARLLVALEASSIRDAAWSRIGRDDLHTHQALWRDLTRRAPDEVRAPAASLLAFASWLGGDGAGGWCALDQIPENNRAYPMAELVAAALQGGMNPAAWESIETHVSRDENGEQPSLIDRTRLAPPPERPGISGPSRTRPPPR